MKVKLIAITQYVDGSVEDLIFHASMACRGMMCLPGDSRPCQRDSQTIIR